MKHLKYILILALSSAMGTLQAQDLKELMKENRENREANYAKWGPTSDHDGMGYVVRAGFVLGGTTPLPLPKEIRKINEFAPKGGFSLGIDGYKYFNTRWGLSAGLRFFMQGMRTGAEVKNYNMAIVMGEDVVEGRFTGTDITETRMTGFTIPVTATYRVGALLRLQRQHAPLQLRHGVLRGPAREEAPQRVRAAGLGHDRRVQRRFRDRHLPPLPDLCHIRTRLLLLITLKKNEYEEVIYLIINLCKPHARVRHECCFNRKQGI